MKKLIIRLYLRLFNPSAYTMLRCYEGMLLEYEKRKRWKERTSEMKNIIEIIERKFPIFKDLAKKGKK